MEQRICKKNHPSTVLKLYIRLYCKKRNASKFKMMEAVKSWTTLKQSERDKFINKYNECQINYKKKLINYLRKVQPYLKAKKAKRAFSHTSIEGTTKGAENENKQLTDKESDIHDKVSGTLNNTLANIVESQPIIQMNMFETPYNNNEFSDSPPRQVVATYENSSTCVLAEPSPPNIMNAKELFELIKTSKGSTETWISLSSTQKSRYRKAVFLLKDSYIKKFKAYLESLPPKKLYDYYNNYMY